MSVEDNDRTHLQFVVVAIAALSACSPADNTTDAADFAGAQVGTPCSISPQDRAWLDRSLDAWHFASAELSGIGAVDELTMVVFDAECTLTSRDAMTGGTAEEASFETVRHEGEVLLPDGETMPPVVTSFTQTDGVSAYFTIALPSVWAAGNVPPGPLGLPDLITAVLLHEGSHVVQFPTYGEQISALIEREGLPDSFNDDSVQDRFGEDQVFATTVEREIALFLAASSEVDDVVARSLAQEGRDLMKDRRSKYFIGRDAHLLEAEDLWLTLEGSAQWVGFAWLVHSEGGQRTISDAMDGYGQRSRWWTQNQGFALAMAINRLDAEWTSVLFGSADRTLIDILDDVLAAEQ